MNRPAFNEITEFVDVSEAFAASMFRLHDASIISPRGYKTKEISPYSFYVLNPSNLFVFNPFRQVNPFAQIAETLWVLAGRNDLDWLERYIPQCKKWSDDGKTWRAGYGPRLRYWRGSDMFAPDIDQVKEVLKHIGKDSSTRQAVISLWDPGLDWVKSKDIPCNNWLQFMVRDGYLNLHVTVRSNDAVFGFSHVDFFQWSVLQHMMAFWTGHRPGFIYWTAGSFHIYERHFDMAQNMYDLDFFEKPYTQRYNINNFMYGFNTSHLGFDKTLDRMFEYVEWLWTFPFDFKNEDSYVTNVAGRLAVYDDFDMFFIMCAKALAVHRFGVESVNVMYVLDKLIDPYTDLYHAIVQYFIGKRLAAGSEKIRDDYQNVKTYHEDLYNAAMKL